MANEYFKKEIPGMTLIIKGKSVTQVETLSRDVGVIALDPDMDDELVEALKENVGRFGLSRISQEQYEELKKKPKEQESSNLRNPNAKLGIHPSSQKPPSLPANVANQPAQPAEPAPPPGLQSTLRKFVPRTMRQAEVSRLDAGQPPA